MKEKVLLSWSGGKDSALALYELQKNRKYEVATLLTTINEYYNRTSMHGVRTKLLETQAEYLGLPLEKVIIAKDITNEQYEYKMRQVLLKYLSAGVSYVVFGDIFLEDLRKYREDNLSKIGMKGIFPLWEMDTAMLAHNFVDLGFRAVITCIDLNYLGKMFIGSKFDKQFLSLLPLDVDPCGENGEFHTFVYDGPIFRKVIKHTKGEVVERDGNFCFCDLLPLWNDETASCISPVAQAN